MSHTLEIAERFWQKVDRSRGIDSCWMWVRQRDACGYGRLQIGTRNALAHRVSWELNRGDIPKGMHVLHRCDQPGCVNPGHLFLGTHQDNMADMYSKGRRPAPRGIRNGRVKLSEQDVLDIRANYALCRVTQAELAQRFGVSSASINFIVNGKNWRHLPCQKEPNV